MDVSRLSGFGFEIENSQLAESLGDFAQTIVIPYMRKQIKEKAYDTGEYFRSIRAEVVDDPDSDYVIQIVVDEPASSYFDFIEKGVRGSVSSTLAPNSPYQFGTGTGRPGGLTEAITKWTKRKGIDKKYIFPIVRNIYKFGLKPRPIFGGVDGVEQYAQDVIDIYANNDILEAFDDDMNAIVDNLINQLNR